MSFTFLTGVSLMMFKLLPDKIINRIDFAFSAKKCNIQFPIFVYINITQHHLKIRNSKFFCKISNSIHLYFIEEFITFLF